MHCKQIERPVPREASSAREGLPNYRYAVCVCVTGGCNIQLHLMLLVLALLKLASFLHSSPSFSLCFSEEQVKVKLALIQVLCSGGLI